jgi:hypothetical protein
MKRVPVTFHHLILPLSDVAAAAYDLTYNYPNKKRVLVMFHQLILPLSDVAAAAYDLTTSIPTRRGCRSCSTS